MTLTFSEIFKPKMPKFACGCTITPITHILYGIIIRATIVINLLVGPIGPRILRIIIK